MDILQLQRHVKIAVIAAPWKACTCTLLEGIGNCFLLPGEMAAAPALPARPGWILWAADREADRTAATLTVLTLHFTMTSTSGSTPSTLLALALSLRALLICVLECLADAILELLAANCCDEVCLSLALALVFRLRLLAELPCRACAIPGALTAAPDVSLLLRLNPCICLSAFLLCPPRSAVQSSCAAASGCESSLSCPGCSSAAAATDSVVKFPDILAVTAAEISAAVTVAPGALSGCPPGTSVSAGPSALGCTCWHNWFGMSTCM